MEKLNINENKIFEFSKYYLGTYISSWFDGNINFGFSILGKNKPKIQSIKGIAPISFLKETEMFKTYHGKCFFYN